MPFTIGGTEIVLVPNKRSGAEPTVLLIARHRGSRMSGRLTLAETRRLAAYLSAAANEAEVLGRRGFAEVHRSERLPGQRFHGT